jgi:hypothetical protein
MSKLRAALAGLLLTNEAAGRAGQPSGPKGHDYLNRARPAGTLQNGRAIDATFTIHHSQATLRGSGHGPANTSGPARRIHNA